jgi:hypothetical protein
MRIEQLYLTKVIPLLSEFRICDIYNYELKKLDQELAESINQKNIYTALDLPDFKNIKEVKLEASIINLTCKKLNIGKDINIIKENNYKILQIDNEKFQLIFFPSGSVPEIDIKLEKIIFFMYQPKFQKIYFCGKYNLKKITKSNIDKFYTNLCFNGTKKFIGFNELDR